MILSLLISCASTLASDVSAKQRVENIDKVDALSKTPVVKGTEKKGLGCPEILPKGDPRLEGTVVVVFKKERRIGLYSKRSLVREEEKGYCYPMALAPRASLAPKEVQGDRKTPEGWYRTSDKPWSRFSHAIAVHYPNAKDAERGLKNGRITKSTYQSIVSSTKSHKKPPQNTRLGGEILIHGDGGRRDWTLGCVGMENNEILELRKKLPKSMQTWTWILHSVEDVKNGKE